MTQILLVGAALAGVALTFVGNAWLERQKWRRARSAEDRTRSLQAFADLLQSVTDIARILRQSAERLESSGNLDTEKLAVDVDELIGQARQHGTMARLVGPPSAYSLIKEVEDVFAPLFLSIGSIRGADDTATLVDPARKLMKLRDQLIEGVRAGEDASS